MKQKKYLKNVNRPTNDEINSSNVCKQMNISFENFQQIKSNSESHEEFEQFFQDFSIFLSEETNLKLLYYYSPLMIQSTIEHISLIEFNPILVNQTFSLIDVIIEKVGVTFTTSSFTSFFFYLANGEEETFRIIENNEKIFKIVFSNEGFFFDFVRSSLFDYSFQKIFLIDGNEKIGTFYTNLIINNSPIKLLDNYDFKPIISMSQQSVNENKPSYQIAIFLTSLFSIIASQQNFFNDESNFEMLSKLLNNSSFDMIIECFKKLIFTNIPNYEILKNILNYYLNHSNFQEEFFEWIFEFIKENPSECIKMNSVVQFLDWITPQTSISSLVNSMKIIYSVYNPLLSQFLPIFFSILVKEETDIDTYSFGINLVESQIYHRQISLSFLLNSLFLDAFIVKPSIGTLSEIIQKIYTFPQLVYDIYALPDAGPIRQKVLNKIIEATMNNDELTGLVSAFLVLSDTKENLREIMKLIEDRRSSNLCDSLCSAFLKNEVMVNNFLQENGMKWICKIFDDQIIDLEIMQKLIVGLTSRAPKSIVDDYIKSLPKDHPLFSIDKESIKSMVYGFEDPPAFYPIKVHSLFHLIQCPWSIDPYNSYIIGKYVMKKYDDILNLPIIAEIGNRYITDDIFYLLLKHPSQLKRFLDPTFDHFPIFQVFEFEEKMFDINFNSISFWFKFASSIDESLKIPFFHSNKLHIFLKKNTLIANYEGVEYDVVIDPLKWNHIFISLSPKPVSHKLKIWVNLVKASFTSPEKLPYLSNFGFLVYSSYLYIGSAIRFYKTKSKEFAKICELGPSSMEKLNEDILITPYSTAIRFEKNILPVPYYGFPSHFKSKSKLNYFFDIMKNMDNDDDFEKMLSAYFDLYSIMNKSIPDLLDSLLSFFASAPEKLTKNRFIRILSFFGKCMDFTELLNEIMKNQLFWNNVSNDIIIFSLISFFKTFDFYEEIDKFQFFLVNKMILNPKSKYIIMSFLVNSKALPKCKKCLFALFICHHFMEKKENKAIQCSIPTKALITKNENENGMNADTSQYFKLVNKSNVSIQCDLSDEITYFDEHLLIFNEVKNTELQFNLIECFCEFIEKSENLENIKSSLPVEDLLSLFIVSQNSFKASLFKLIVLIEKASPGFMYVDNIFLTAFFPLFIYQSVWDDALKLVSDDGENIDNPFVISLLLALVWAFTAASLHSVARTGKKLSLSYDKEIRFCLKNSKAIVSNKTALHFIKTWYPLLFGFNNSNNSFTTSPFRLESVEVIPPRVSNFSHYIWSTVIQSAREIDPNLPIKTEKFYSEEFKKFVSNSELILFLTNLSISLPDNQFLHFFSSFLIIPSIAEKDISEVFVSEFTTNCLTYLSQTFSTERPFNSIISVIHYLNNSGLLKSNFQFVLSDVFVIMSLLRDLHSKIFKKNLSALNNLLIDLFVNCEIESLPILFNILQQYAVLFAQIVQMTNSLDNYLFIFQKVAHNCYKEFDFFFKKFLNSAKFKNDKKIEDLLNHVPFDENANKSKWNKLLNSTSSNSRQAKSEKNDCYNAITSEWLDNSKEYSITYFVSRKRQHNFCESLTNFIDTIEQAQTPQDFFNSSIKLAHESIKDSITISINSEKVDQYCQNFKLLPFSFPFSLPRLQIPAPIVTDDQAIKFIVDNKLYSNKISSFEDLEKVSVGFFGNYKKVSRPKVRISSLSSSQNSNPFYLSNSTESCAPEEENNEKTSNRNIKRASSMRLPLLQSIPPSSDEIVIDENSPSPTVKKKYSIGGHPQSIGSQVPFNAVFSHAMSNSFFIPAPSVKQINRNIFNCQLTRLNYSIPTIVSISMHNLRLIPFCRYDPTGQNDYDEFAYYPVSSCPAGNYPLAPEFVCKFVMEVINGYWGDTKLYDKRIVIKIPLNTILFAVKKNETNYTFWTQKSGTFMLTNVENDIFEQIPFMPMSPIGQIEDKDQVVSKWSEGLISASQMIIALNILDKRDYVDTRNFVTFPDSLSTFGVLSPINETLAANLHEGLIIGHSKYSNSIEFSENYDAIVEYLKRFDLKKPVEKPVIKSNFTSESTIFCQKISGCFSDATLFGDDSIITDLPLLSVGISYPFYITVDKNQLALYIFDKESNRKIFVYQSEDFRIAKAISVSQNFMFFSIDFENDITYVYQIIYEDGLPARLEFIQENSFLFSQGTSVTGIELLAATFSGKSVYIWPFYRSSCHRIINFDEKVRFCQFDDNAGTFWACDEFSCFLFDCNGKLFSNYKFQKKITAFAVVRRPIQECDRSAICGFVDGSVAIISPKIESGELFAKELNNCHHSKIIKFAFHPSNSYFISIDNCGNAVFWSQKNSGEVKEIDMALFDSCPACGRKPSKFCLSCKRAFCDECLNESQVCPDCFSIDN